MIEKCFPIQILGPAANGKKVKGLLCFPGANLSGSNFKGSSQCFSDLCIVSRGTINRVAEDLSIEQFKRGVLKHTYRYHRSLAGGILYCTRARVQYKISPRGRQPEAEIFSYSTEGPTGPSAIR